MTNLNYKGFGTARTKLGLWLDSRGISQSWLKERTGLNINTISDLASNKERYPNQNTLNKILKALSEIDPSVTWEDFLEI